VAPGSNLADFGMEMNYPGRQRLGEFDRFGTLGSNWGQVRASARPQPSYWTLV